MFGHELTIFLKNFGYALDSLGKITLTFTCVNIR